jgi:hypothetical protein
MRSYPHILFKGGLFESERCKLSIRHYLQGAEAKVIAGALLISMQDRAFSGAKAAIRLTGKGPSLANLGFCWATAERWQARARLANAKPRRSKAMGTLKRKN